MSATTPTTNQRVLLDVIGTLGPAWDVDVTYPTLPEVTHRFSSLPELVLTTADGSHEIAVRASIAEDKVFHGYVVTTTYPERALLVPECRERRLTSLSQQELLAERIGITHYTDPSPTSDRAVEASLSLSAAVSLAGYYAARVDLETDAGDDQTPAAVPAGDD